MGGAFLGKLDKLKGLVKFYKLPHGRATRATTHFHLLVKHKCSSRPSPWGKSTVTSNNFLSFSDITSKVCVSDGEMSHWYTNALSVIVLHIVQMTGVYGYSVHRWSHFAVWMSSSVECSKPNIFDEIIFDGEGC